MNGPLDEFVTTLRTQLEIFVNRMKSNSSRGRSITNDSSVQTLFMNTMAMHSKLLKHIQDQEDKRVHYEGLQVCKTCSKQQASKLTFLILPLFLSNTFLPFQKFCKFLAFSLEFQKKKSPSVEQFFLNSRSEQF